MRDDYYIEDGEQAYRFGFEVGIDCIENNDSLDMENFNHSRFLNDEMVDDFKRGYKDGVREGIDKVYGDIEESTDE